MNQGSPGWRYFNPVRVIYKPGAIDELAAHLGGRRVVLVTSAGFVARGVVDRIRAQLGSRLVQVVADVKPNPDVRDIDAQASRLRACNADHVLALGGGSSMDTAKALARLLAQPASVTLAAHFRDNSPWPEGRALPLATIPTTSGTGAEVTPFGTVWDFERGKKYSIAGEDLYPAVSILDPQLTLGLPVEVTVSSGLDAISHAFESVWNRNASPVTLGLAAKSLQLSLPALPGLLSAPQDPRLRGDMMQASLLAGLAISQTRTALAHSISYPLTTTYGLPHGLACSFTLPALLLFNGVADDGRLRQLARALGYEDIEKLYEGLCGTFSALGVAELLSRHIPQLTDMLNLTDRMITPGRADNNLRDANPEDVRTLVTQTIGLIESGYAAVRA